MKVKFIQPYAVIADANMIWKKTKPSVFQLSSCLVPHLISIWNPFLDWIQEIALLRVS